MVKPRTRFESFMDSSKIQGFSGIQLRFGGIHWIYLGFSEIQLGFSEIQLGFGGIQLGFSKIQLGFSKIRWDSGMQHTSTVSLKRIQSYY